MAMDCADQFIHAVAEQAREGPVAARDEPLPGHAQRDRCAIEGDQRPRRRVRSWVQIYGIHTVYESRRVSGYLRHRRVRVSPPGGFPRPWRRPTHEPRPPARHVRRASAADRPAIFEGTQPWATHAQWAARSAGLAQRLRAGGLAPGDRVVVFMRNHPRYLEILWARLVGRAWWSCRSTPSCTRPRSSGSSATPRRAGAS